MADDADPQRPDEEPEVVADIRDRPAAPSEPAPAPDAAPAAPADQAPADAAPAQPARPGQNDLIPGMRTQSPEQDPEPLPSGRTAGHAVAPDGPPDDPADAAQTADGPERAESGPLEPGLPDAAPAEPAVVPEVPASGPATRKPPQPPPRRWLRVLAACVALLFALLIGAVWFVSDRIGAATKVAQSPLPMGLSVTQVQGDQVTYSGTDPDVPDVGLQGLLSNRGGYSETSAEVQNRGDLHTRTITRQQIAPRPRVGDELRLDGYYYPKDPRVGLGIPFGAGSVPTALGPMPAWFVPGSKSTWVIFVHDLAATRAEGLRILETTHRLGYPTLLISYRNDPGAPSAGGHGQFGYTEWEDLQSAVRFARDSGARHVILAGAGMGGAICEAFMKKSSLAQSVTGMFLDSPASSFRDIVKAQASDRYIPAILTDLAMWVSEKRYGFNFAKTDYLSWAPDIKIPVQVIQGDADQEVPAAVNLSYVAGARSANFQIALFPGASHGQAWNVNRQRYVALLEQFLAKAAP